MKYNEQDLTEIIEGLSQKQKSLPSKFFYDQKGSELFDQICELDEYYQTRTEAKIMTDNIDQITSVFENNTLLIEFGSGSSLKTRLLLEHLPNLSGYIPIDISKDHLLKSVKQLRFEFPDLEIAPMIADYTRALTFPPIHRAVEHKVTFFPGSTIGNFQPEYAKEFLRVIADECGQNGGLLIGVDLKKEEKILYDAYNDSKGVTAEFNINILRRINREFDGDFVLNYFDHEAVYNSEHGRIEMHLICNKDKQVHIADKNITFKKGESILTEYSYKYSIEEFAALASDVFVLRNYWTDENRLFCVMYFDVK
ncbi:MAG: L-histidine N(alpha)-methyltransferase [Melioribacteraceae bacterium]|nr:L-histidine N(alpha)-methyltransferase [Melioribacteraceae bacterium]MCF8352988.1 L-histidine N(alpha)-methyltransferase [Melioribacteraceae bacterium]MCF8392879.1 L-histidine N(alpha)-methyltransferase [Melioribacteraceae bacterium]MCF8417827.1 L-histidine N(alpha)-methyltransferase [Melioribacteraceae bacterium]